MNDSLNAPVDSGIELQTRHVASSRFEAARQLAGGGGGRLARLHGHGFMVSVFAGDSDLRAWTPYPGGEVPVLLDAVKRQTARLDYQSLNGFLPEPSDTNVARWFGEQIDMPAIYGLALQSTPEQGVVLGGREPVVWRRYRFQAAHQLPNVPVGHKCGRLHGHGFEVVLYAASVEESVSYEKLDDAWAPLARQLSHRCLNDIAGLENPTSEMLSSWIWQRLLEQLPTLSAVSVYETASCGATFDGQHYRIWKDFSLDSAVRYRHAAPTDPRASVHGYTYTLRLNLSAPLDQVMGWTVDFGDVKEVFNPVFKSLDHHPLHENPELVTVSDGDTGSMAKWLFLKVQDFLPELVCVDLFETEGCGSSVGTDLRGPVLPLVRV